MGEEDVWSKREEDSCGVMMKSGSEAYVNFPSYLITCHVLALFWALGENEDKWSPPQAACEVWGMMAIPPSLLSWSQSSVVRVRVRPPWSLGNVRKLLDSPCLHFHLLGSLES